MCATYVSEGTSLEEQVRRIKDIEAIESDSFVPQAFKSSRDDIKVRSASLSLPAPHSLAFHSVFYWISLSAMLCRLSRDSPDQIKHSHSAPFVPTWDRFIRRSTVHRLQSSSTHTKATAGSSHPLSPPSGCADADKTQKSLLKCSRLWWSRN